jgi:hypothetical protein
LVAAATVGRRCAGDRTKAGQKAATTLARTIVRLARTIVRLRHSNSTIGHLFLESSE